MSDLWNRWQRSSMAIWVNSWDCDLEKFAKAYLMTEGTTTDKCASSAESDVFIQAVALLDAVIPQTVRRCDLLVWLLLRTATIAFVTELWADKLFPIIRLSIQIRFNGLSDLSRKDTSTDADQKYDVPMPCSCVNLWLFSNYTPSGLLFSCIWNSLIKWLSQA